MTHDEMIAVIQHHKNGGEVEASQKYADKWNDSKNPAWDFYNYIYRKKEKPKTKIVYECIAKQANGQWYVLDRLYTEDELNSAFREYQKTGRQWEVPND